MALVTENSLCRLVLDWVKRQMKEDNLSVSVFWVFFPILDFIRTKFISDATTIGTLSFTLFGPGQFPTRLH
jgi:hypothetical protein